MPLVRPDPQATCGVKGRRDAKELYGPGGDQALSRCSGPWGLVASGQAANGSGRMTTHVPDPLDIGGEFGWFSTCLGSVRY